MPVKSSFKPKSQKQKMVEAQKQTLNFYNSERAGTSDVDQGLSELLTNSHAAAAMDPKPSTTNVADTTDTAGASIKQIGHKV
jgi:hypothetical protein